MCVQETLWVWISCKWSVESCFQKSKPLIKIFTMLLRVSHVLSVFSTWEVCFHKRTERIKHKDACSISGECLLEAPVLSLQLKTS